MTVGNLSQTDSDVADNILKSIAALGDGIPGGFANIRNMVLKTVDSKSVPMYLSLGPKDEVILPKARRVKETPTPEDVSTVLNARVTVDSRGVLKIISTSKSPRIPRTKRGTVPAQTDAIDGNPATDNPQTSGAAVEIVEVKAKKMKKENKKDIKKTATSVIDTVVIKEKKSKAVAAVVNKPLKRRKLA